MESDQLETLRKCCKDSDSFLVAKKMFLKAVSKWKKTEKDLCLLEEAISNDYDSILITELDLEEPGPRIVYVNKGFEKLTGYKKADVIGKTPRILQGPKTDRKTLNRLKKSLREGKSFFGQAINYRKDGSEFIMQWDIHPLHNEKGEITHWVSYQQDISKRKQAEFSFHETTAEFDSLTEFSKRTLIDIDTNGTITTVNTAFLKLTGYNRNEIVSKKLWDLVIDAEQDELRKKLQELINLNGHNSIERILTFVSKNGISIETHVTFFYHELSDGILIRAVVNNIGLRKKVLKVLEKRNYNFERLVENKTEFSYGLDLTDPEHPTFSWLSEGFTSLTGYSPEKFMGKDGWQKLIHPDDLSKVRKHLEKIRNGKPSTEEYRIRCAGNKSLKILDHASPAQQKKGGRVEIITGSVLKPVNQHSGFQS